MKIRKIFLLIFTICISEAKAQYVQAERNDTTYLYPKTLFDSTVASNALAHGNSTIKGVAFTKPRTGFGYKAPFDKRIYANKIKILIFPVTPYLLEYLDLQKSKETPKKLRFVYMSNQAYYYHYEAITNSVGEFTIPNLKPGKYYLEGILPWYETKTFHQYEGYSEGYGGGTDYYSVQNYNVNHYDKLKKFVDIQNDGETIEIKLK